MDKLKFTLFSIIILLLVGFLLYWSISTLQSGPEYATSQKLHEIQKENEDLKKEVTNLTNKLGILEPKSNTPILNTPEISEQIKPSTSKGTVAPTKPTVYKYQSLIDELQKLVDEDIFMKLKSSGIRVGVIQKFLNIYNNTSNKIDNDYGASTVKLVSAFQKAEGLQIDGGAGSSTFQKMIDWLEKQG